MTRITIDCPDELLVGMGTSAEQFEREARLAMAAKLFELGRLSSGSAARLARMGRAQFLLSLASMGVAAIDLDEAEFEHEARYARGQ